MQVRRYGRSVLADVNCGKATVHVRLCDAKAVSCVCDAKAVSCVKGIRCGRKMPRASAHRVSCGEMQWGCSCSRRQMSGSRDAIGLA